MASYSGGKDKVISNEDELDGLGKDKTSMVMATSDKYSLDDGNDSDATLTGQMSQLLINNSRKADEHASNPDGPRHQRRPQYARVRPDHRGSSESSGDESDEKSEIQQKGQMYQSGNGAGHVVPTMNQGAARGNSVRPSQLQQMRAGPRWQTAGDQVSKLSINNSRKADEHASNPDGPRHQRRPQYASGNGQIKSPEIQRLFPGLHCLLDNRNNSESSGDESDEKSEIQQKGQMYQSGIRAGHVVPTKNPGAARGNAVHPSQLQQMRAGPRWQTAGGFQFVSGAPSSYDIDEIYWSRRSRRWCRPASSVTYAHERETHYLTVGNRIREALTASMLDVASPIRQKQMLGEHLFPLIQRMNPELAGKITGMLLELDNFELLHMLKPQESLKAKIQQIGQMYQSKIGAGYVDPTMNPGATLFYPPHIPNMIDGRRWQTKVRPAQQGCQFVSSAPSSDETDQTYWSRRTSSGTYVQERDTHYMIIDIWISGVGQRSICLPFYDPFQEALTASMLDVASSPQEREQMLREHLFPLIQRMNPELAGKITGMLLCLDNFELLQMLKPQESLKAKVEEAVAVLQAHQAMEVAANQAATNAKKKNGM